MITEKFCIHCDYYIEKYEEKDGDRVIILAFDRCGKYPDMVSGHPGDCDWLRKSESEHKAYVCGIRGHGFKVRVHPVEMARKLYPDAFESKT